VDIRVQDNVAAARYEARVGDTLAAYAEYRVEGGRVVFTHTEVEAEFEGQGVGSVLARGALADVRGRGLNVVPLCPFIRGWIEKHPDYQDLVVR